MVIQKIFNNNCVLVSFEDTEFVITGSGVGFHKKIGEAVDITRIEKKFELIEDYRENFELLIKRVPFEFFNLTQQIVDHAVQTLNVNLDAKLNISLTDHISYAVNRCREGIVMPTLFSREIQEFYPEEYEIGLWALKLIEANQDVVLPLEEASFIALHILNSASDNSAGHIAQTITVFIQDCLRIIEKTLNTKFDRNTVSFSRTVTHLKYLAKRVVEGSTTAINHSSSDFVSKMLLRFSSSKEAVNEIETYIRETYNYTLDEDECLYLSIHIHQLSSKS